MGMGKLCAKGVISPVEAPLARYNDRTLSRCRLIFKEDQNEEETHILAALYCDAAFLHDGKLLHEGRGR